MEHGLLKLSEKLKNNPGITVLTQEPMSRHTTFRIGGPAELFVETSGVDAAKLALESAYAAGVTPTVIGNGSNLLVSDDGIKGLVIKISGGECTCDEGKVSVDAGVSLVTVSRFAQRMQLEGMEFLYGIPGSMGGAVVMNAGAYGGEISQILTGTTYYSPSDGVCELSAEEHDFGYRTSFFKHNPQAIVLRSSFKLKSCDGKEVLSRMDELMKRRRDKQPLEYPSAGSVFKRPPGYFAGALIEQCGLKGFSVGGAQVSEKHAGFIINRGEATCDDVCKLIEHIRKTVLKNTGVELECEVCRI